MRPHGVSASVSWKLLEHALGIPEMNVDVDDEPGFEESVACAILLSRSDIQGETQRITVDTCSWASDNYDLGVIRASERQGLPSVVRSTAVAALRRPGPIGVMAWAPTVGLRNFVFDQIADALGPRGVVDLSESQWQRSAVGLTGAHPTLGLLQVISGIAELYEREGVPTIVCIGTHGLAAQGSFATVLTRNADV
jgi:hypothetical protein